jgi:hypothetical protein
MTRRGFGRCPLWVRKRSVLRLCFGKSKSEQYSWSSLEVHNKCLKDVCVLSNFTLSNLSEYYS